MAANTVAGTISGWIKALELAREYGGSLPAARLLEDAIGYARDGIPVTRSQNVATNRARGIEGPAGLRAQLSDRWRSTAHRVSRFRQPGLYRTFTRLAQEGSELVLPRVARTRIRAPFAASWARRYARRSGAAGSRRGAAVAFAALGRSKCLNLPPPTQGLVSLLILARWIDCGLDRTMSERADFVHLTVEATKQAFKAARPLHLRSPRYADRPESLLQARVLSQLAAGVDRKERRAVGKCIQPAGRHDLDGGDRSQRSCSLVHSKHLPRVWQRCRAWRYRRGLAEPRRVVPARSRSSAGVAAGRKPFHTLNPAGARLNDGRHWYTARWAATVNRRRRPPCSRATPCSARMRSRPSLHLAGCSAVPGAAHRTRSSSSNALTLRSWRNCVHAATPSSRCRDFDEAVGHAGLIAAHQDGVLEAAADPRSDGLAAGF